MSSADWSNRRIFSQPSRQSETKWTRNKFKWNSIGTNGTIEKLPLIFRSIEPLNVVYVVVLCCDCEIRKKQWEVCHSSISSVSSTSALSFHTSRSASMPQCLPTTIVLLLSSNFTVIALQLRLRLPMIANKYTECSIPFDILLNIHLNRLQFHLFNTMTICSTIYLSVALAFEYSEGPSCTMYTCNTLKPALPSVPASPYSTLTRYSETYTALNYNIYPSI